ncbi:hypothetical protein BDM02DRAFT_3254809 [Thelephora ganbajun]|uniref:Uncharacterized protein n=1 Tax=Thelephora ganbajun TaxID=370292 RepID=A0ACB6ZBG4_THEGA|nr:hypothetical protein BDM02DRAFT_3254809 [Thelephora ganbajun]
MHNTKLLPTIYLPSSGGYTGSRITPEPATHLTTSSLLPAGGFHFAVIASKRTGVWLHPCPYAKPAVRFSTPPSHCASIPLDPETPPTRPALASTSDPNPTVELLKSLVPALVKDPASFEESISSICAAHDIDKSVISAMTQATRHSSVSPIKQERQFPSGSPGVTTWYSSHSLSVLHGPPSNLGPNVGDLYMHNNHAEASHQIWLFGLDHSWMRVDIANKVYHPIITNRVLSMRANGTPSWITAASYTTIKGHKEKAKAIE